MPSSSPAVWFHAGATALLLMDLQQGTCGDAQPQPQPLPDFDHRFHATTLPNAQRVLAAARQSELEVIHTVIANLTADGRDRSVDYKPMPMSWCSPRAPRRPSAPPASTTCCATWASARWW